MYNDRCLGCQRYATCKTISTEYEGSDYILTLCKTCWDCWWEFVMVNKNRYRKVENVSFIKKHQMSVVRDTIKHILAEVESRRLLAQAEINETKEIAEMIPPSEVDSDTKYAEWLYEQYSDKLDKGE
jgi:hypothetical protein